MVKAWSRLYGTLKVLATAEGPWACLYEQTKWGSNYKLEPLWARDYAHELLFLNVPHVLLASATITRKTLELLGLGEEVDFQQYPYLFPIKRSPIIHVPTVFVKQDMTDEDRGIMESRVDQIVGARLDRKGLVHTVSYKLAEALKKYCMHNDVMRVHEKSAAATREAVRLFRLAEPPAVLVSPSIGTGLDFPGKDAEYQIIPKLPFVPIKGDPIMEARCRKKQGGDPGYADYLMAQTLTQQFGRAMRSAQDQSETFILDDNWLWVRSRLKQYFPTWVWPLVRRMDHPPSPPPPLERAL